MRSIFEKPKYFSKVLDNAEWLVQEFPWSNASLVSLQDFQDLAASFFALAPRRAKTTLPFRVQGTMVIMVVLILVRLYMPGL